MTKRENHYEAAFEAYLRERRTPYVAVDESRRSLSDGLSLKSLDFIVSPTRAPGDSRPAWLVDVKGRLFPAGSQNKQYWKNWSTRDDLDSMASWERLFGAGFAGLFVFAYAIVGDRSPVVAEELYAFRGRTYGFVGIRFADYCRSARPLSQRWDTVAMPAAEFRRLAAPMAAFLSDEPAAWSTCLSTSPAQPGVAWDLAGGAPLASGIDELAIEEPWREVW
jgi:hypothetical protein